MSWIDMVLVSSLALEKYWSILARSSISIFVAFLTLFLDTTSFWCRLLVLLFLLLWPFLLKEGYNIGEKELKDNDEIFFTLLLFLAHTTPRIPAQTALWWLQKDLNKSISQVFFRKLKSLFYQKVYFQK